jgi:hypothetical protein
MIFKLFDQAWEIVMDALKEHKSALERDSCEWEYDEHRRDDIRALRASLEEIGTKIITGDMIEGYRIQMTTGTKQILELRLYRPDLLNSQEAIGGTTVTGSTGPATTTAEVKPNSFHGSIQIEPSATKMHFVRVAEDLISFLASNPKASPNITLEINAEFPSEASDQFKRPVSENANALGFKSKSCE